MRKSLVVAALALAGVVGTEGRSGAWLRDYFPSSFPQYPGAVYTPCGGYGYGVGHYYYPPYYPWFAYYNYAYSPYAWPWGTYRVGYYPAYVPGVTDRPPFTVVGGEGGAAVAGPAVSAGAAVAATGRPAKLVLTVPADAEVYFNGVLAVGTGPARTFHTGPLAEGQTYQYVLTAKVVRDGKPLSTTSTVAVLAGGEVPVTLAP